MKASFLVSTGAAIAMATNAFAQDAVIDTPGTVNTVNSYITDHCAASFTGKTCIAAGPDMSLSVAKSMGTYIDRYIAPQNSFSAGLAKGELIASCYAVMDDLGGSLHDGMDGYLATAFDAVKSCENAMTRAGREVGMEFQPTARNTISCHMNKLAGYRCP